MVPRSATGARAGGLAAVGGIVIPGIGVVVLPIWKFPGTGATSDQIGAFVTAHHAALQAMMLLYTSGVTLWLVFGACVWSHLRTRLAADSMVPACFAAGLVGFVTLLLAGFTTFDVLVYRGGEPAHARLLYDVTFGLLAMSGLPTAVSLGAFAVGAYRDHVLPRHTAHLAASSAAAHTVLLLSFIAPGGFLSLEGPVIVVIPALLWAWILATGIALIRANRPLASDVRRERTVHGASAAT